MPAYLDNGHVNNGRDHPLLQYSLVSNGKLGKRNRSHAQRTRVLCVSRERQIAICITSPWNAGP